jgi:hypothetical protein
MNYVMLEMNKYICEDNDNNNNNNNNNNKCTIGLFILINYYNLINTYVKSLKMSIS